MNLELIFLALALLAENTGREFLLMCMFEGTFFFVFLSQPQPVGEPAPGTLTSLHEWAESHGEFYPGPFVMYPDSRADCSFPNPRLRGTGRITFLEPALSYLSKVYSCKLGIFPQLNCMLPICLGDVVVDV